MQNKKSTSMKKEIECTSCGKRAVKVKTDYRYAESGLDNVVLSGINVYKCSCGEVMPAIRKPERLRWFIALALLKKPNLLSGKEFRFLRKQMRWPTSYLVLFLRDGNAVLLSRWVRSDAKVGVHEDRDIRMLYMWVIGNGYREKIREIHGSQAFKMSKKNLAKLENADFKKVHDAIIPEFEPLKLQLKRLKHRSAKAWRYCYYFTVGRGGLWRAQMRRL